MNQLKYKIWITKINEEYSLFNHCLNHTRQVYTSQEYYFHLAYIFILVIVCVFSNRVFTN